MTCLIFDKWSDIALHHNTAVKRNALPVKRGRLAATILGRFRSPGSALVRKAKKRAAPSISVKLTRSNTAELMIKNSRMYVVSVRRIVLAVRVGTGGDANWHAFRAPCAG